MTEKEIREELNSEIFKVIKDILPLKYEDSYLISEAIKGVIKKYNQCLPDEE